MIHAEFFENQTLLAIILSDSVATTGRHTTEARAREMIKSNISILNGKSIAGISEQFYRQQGHIPWKKADLDANAWSCEPEIRKEIKKEETMYTLYKINADELDSSFLKGLKAMFKNKEIEIVVCEAGQSEEDETTYLLKSSANREHLLKAIENVARERNLVTVKLDELQ